MINDDINEVKTKTKDEDCIRNLRWHYITYNLE